MQVKATTTHLNFALIGKTFKLANSTWGSEWSGGKPSACKIVGYVRDLAWPSGTAPALIVQTIADGFNYAFTPRDILNTFGAVARTRAEKEMAILELRARVEEVGFSGTPNPEAPRPTLSSGHTDLDPELRQLQKFVWLSELRGARWRGTSEELHEAYEAAYQAARPARNRSGRDESGRDRTGRARPDDDSAQRQARRNRPANYKAGLNASRIFAYDPVELREAAPLDVGDLGTCRCGACVDDCDCPESERALCTYCGALLFPKEARDAKTRGWYETDCCGAGLCCCRGKVDLPPVARDETIELLWDDESTRKTLVEHARQLNNALALASSPAKKASVPGSDWNPSVVIQGKLHHYIGPLNAADDDVPRYAQLYVHDPAATSDTVAKQRYASLLLPKSTSRPEAARTKAVLDKLQTALRDCNGYVKDFLTAGEIFASEDAPQASFVINPDRCAPGADKRVYDSNRQRRTFNEVSVLCDEQPAKRTIVLRFRDGGLHETDETHRAYEPLHFVLLFPCGDDGWSIGMPFANVAGKSHPWPPYHIRGG